MRWGYDRGKPSYFLDGTEIILPLKIGPPFGPAVQLFQTNRIYKNW